MVPTQKLHLIMPMAGRGSRFFKDGFVQPKPLIELNGAPFFYWAAQSVAKTVDCADLTFVVLAEHVRDFAITEKIKRYYPAARFVVLPEVTAGAALTALRGRRVCRRASRCCSMTVTICFCAVRSISFARRAILLPDRTVRC